MATQSVDLSKLFGAVAQTMLQNQSTLNEADTYNHDHGDNMVQTFEVITQAMKEKSNATPAEQLAYASQLLSAKSQSGSAKLYAQGLQDASKKFVGKTSITPSNGTTLIQTLMGTQKKIPATSVQRPASAPAGADLLGSLLGGLTGQTQAPASSQGAGGDLLGSLLGGLTGGSAAPQQTSGGTGDLLGSLLGGLTGASSGTSSTAGKGQIDVAKLLKMGMAYMQAKQAGSTDMQAILGAIMSSSRMSGSEYRTQSGSLVASTLLQALAGMSRK